MIQNHSKHISLVLDQVMDLLDEKGEDYDNSNSFVEKMVFGDVSWATLIWIKASRLVSILKRGGYTFDSVEDILLDLIAYSAAYLAWRNMLKEKSGVQQEQDDTEL